MATTADFRNGLVIEFNGELYTIVEFQHVKPGKGGAFVRTKLKNLKTGRVIPNTFNAGVKIEVQRVEHLLMKQSSTLRNILKKDRKLRFFSMPIPKQHYRVNCHRTLSWK